MPYEETEINLLKRNLLEVKKSIVSIFLNESPTRASVRQSEQLNANTTAKPAKIPGIKALTIGEVTNAVDRSLLPVA